MNRPNLVLITADDLNWNSVGAYGCRTPECTPHIDALAAQGTRFQHAHVTIAVCQPSRGSLMTGRYPHKSGQEGFFQIEHFDGLLLTEVLQNAGYFNGILGKVQHSSPRPSFAWDYCKDMPELGWGRDADCYARHTGAILRMARDSERPFFLMANAHDPHRPFHGNDAALQGRNGISYPPPSRLYTPEEVDRPGFLPDLPEVRQELAEYASSARRCDDVVGSIVKTLRDAGVYENTLLMFLSDNGMAFPFAKTNCYLHSTRTPWIVSWPGQVAEGAVDGEHFISGIDFMPTVLEAVGSAIPAGVDGKSFLPVLRGAKDPTRRLVFTQFHETSARNRYPMRCVQDRHFGYIFNPWSDGQRVFRNESQSGRTFAAMAQSATGNPELAKRVDLFLHRVVEELYDFEADPDALVNLVDAPRYASTLERLRGELESWMVEHADPALDAFRNRRSPEACADFMAGQ